MCRTIRYPSRRLPANKTRPDSSTLSGSQRPKTKQANVSLSRVRRTVGKAAAKSQDLTSPSSTCRAMRRDTDRSSQKSPYCPQAPQPGDPPPTSSQPTFAPLHALPPALPDDLAVKPPVECPAHAPNNRRCGAANGSLVLRPGAKRVKAPAIAPG